MPRIASNTGARVFEGMKLQTVRSNAHEGTVTEQQLFVGRNKMGEWSAFPDVTVKPKPTVHRVDHSVASLFEFSKLRAFARCL